MVKMQTEICIPMSRLYIHHRHFPADCQFDND